MECRICPRQCGVDRSKRAGVCGTGGLRIARAGKHFGEEPLISGKNGSGTIFFSGCSLRCVYCQNYEVSQYGKGVDISVRTLSDIMRRLEGEGAHNINLVTPTHYAHKIMSALDMYKPNIPICYNTSGYEREETVRELSGYIDIYLTDYKYADSSLAGKLSRAIDYPTVARGAIMAMRETVGEDSIVDGLMKKGVIVRHLVLPGELDNTKGVLDFVRDRLGMDTWLSLMSQYTPCGMAYSISGMDRPLKPIEYKIAVNYAKKLGLYNVFVQELESGGEEYIPQFYGERLS